MLKLRIGQVYELFDGGGRVMKIEVTDIQATSLGLVIVSNIQNDTYLCVSAYRAFEIAYEEGRLKLVEDVEVKAKRKYSDWEKA